MFVERRKEDRFKVNEGSVAVMTPDWPHATMVANVVDISTGGIGLRYSTHQGNLFDSGELALADSNYEVYVNGLPFRTVADVPERASRRRKEPMKRSGVEFEALTARQLSRLEVFINSNAEMETNQKPGVEDVVFNIHESAVQS